MPDSNQESAAFSPDGKWLVYSSFENAGSQVYLQPFPATGEVHLITTTGEGHPVWSHDGRELFFRGIAGANAQPAINEVEISTAPAVTWGAQAKLPIESYYVRNQTRNFDVAPDGQRLLIVLPADATERTEPVAPQIDIVVNWFEELERLVPTK